MKFSKKVLFAQEGAPMPAPEEQAAPMGPEAGAEAAPSPEEQLQQVAGQLLDMLMQQIGDPQAVAAILQMAQEMLAQAAAPAQPQFQRRGGKLVRI